MLDALAGPTHRSSVRKPAKVNSDIEEPQVVETAIEMFEVLKKEITADMIAKAVKFTPFKQSDFSSDSEAFSSSGKRDSDEAEEPKKSIDKAVIETPRSDNSSPDPSPVKTELVAHETS